jgi:Tol biopolymer transport system component
MNRSPGIACVFVVLLAMPVLAADPQDDDPTRHLRSLGGRFVATGFHAGWSSEGKRLTYGHVPIDAGLQIVEVATRKGRAVTDVGKDPSWSWAKGGPIAYVVGNGQDEKVHLVNADGSNPRMLAGGGCPHWSVDGQTLYFALPREGKVRKWDLAKGGNPQDFCDMRRSWYPIVSPDAKQVAFVEKGQFVVVTATSGEVVLFHKLPSANGWLVNWSPDGKWVAFGGYGGTDGVGLWLLDVERRQVAQIDAGPFTQPAFSPDGTMLAVDLRSNSRPWEVWVIETTKLRELPFVDVTSD